MKKLIKYGLGILLIGSFLTSCSRRLVPTSTIVTKDSIVYKDTTVFVEVPVKVKGDSVTIHDTIAGIPKTVKAQNTVTKGKNTASYKIDNGTITVDCNTAAYEDTIKDLRVKLQTQQSYHSKEQVTTVPVEVVKYKTPTWIKWLLGIEALLVIVYVLGKTGYLAIILDAIRNLLKK